MEAKKKLQRKPAAPRMPEIRIGAPQVHLDAVAKMDMKEMNAEIGALTRAMVQLAKQQEAILKAIEQQAHVIGVLAQRPVNVDIPEIKTPKIPARPSSFEVDFRKEDGETVGLSIRGSKTH